MDLDTKSTINKDSAFGGVFSILFQCLFHLVLGKKWNSSWRMVILNKEMKYWRHCWQSFQMQLKFHVGGTLVCNLFVFFIIAKNVMEQTSHSKIFWAFDRNFPHENPVIWLPGRQWIRDIFSVCLHIGIWWKLSLIHCLPEREIFCLWLFQTIRPIFSCFEK